MSQNCAVLNLLLFGTRIRLLTAVEAPQSVMLHLPSGAVRAARRCWQQQADVGFEFLEPLLEACGNKGLLAQ
jgi:hypothetical protein